MSKRGWKGVVVVAVTLAVSLCVWVVTSRSDPASATYVGQATCATCHKPQHSQWQGSHHALAMQDATAQTILGDFNDAVFTEEGVTTRFFKRGGKFYVNAEGPDGKHHDYEVKYTFGVEPLQQYLVEFPGGRMQALTVVWDTVNRRWYSLYPQERIAADDWLHWTGRAFNWNSMCAECHSTDLKRNYDFASDTYKTTWFEMNVSCEACHGPGSNHVAWTGSKLSQYFDSSYGLTRHLKDPTRVWGHDEQGNPRLISTSNPDPAVQVEACAPCHSRRDLAAGDDNPLAPYLDSYAPAMLLENLYHADGQILDEVYEHGSFAQSKMYHKGVRCSDCHDAHTTKVFTTGNALCLRCHQTDRYETPAHHHHALNTPGASCVECHMPGKHYMVVDFRRDHSLRVPRPDQTVSMGVPNACSQCHKDKDAQWAADAVVQWYGSQRKHGPQWTEALHAGREGKPTAEAGLVSLAGDEDSPQIVRATALWLLRRYGGQPATRAMLQAAKSPHALLRYAGAGGLDRLAHAERVAAAGPLLDDAVTAVRMEAVRSLLDVERDAMGPFAASFEKRLVEYRQLLESLADNRGGWLGLGNLYAARNRLDKAEQAFKNALHIDSRFAEAHMNFATLLNQLGRNAEAETHLLRVVALQPQFGEAWYSLGLLLAEDGARLAEAVTHLAKAAGMMPLHARVHYNLGLGYNSLRRVDEAERSLLRALEIEPNHPDFLFGVASFYAEHGRHVQALEHARRLAALFPSDPDIQRFIAEIGRSATQNP